MKIKKFFSLSLINLLSLFFLLSLITLSPNLHTAEHSNKLKGSVVKSKKWKIDKKNNLEIFEGNVSLHGTDYAVLCEHATYYRNKKYWKLKDNISLTKFFDKERKIDVYGDYAEYFEEKKEMIINGIKNKVKVHYMQHPDTNIKAESNKLALDVKSSIATFYENFSITKGNISAYSENAVYNQKEESFLLFGSSPTAPLPKIATGGHHISGFPYIIGQYDKYNFAIKGDKIKINETNKTTTFTDNVQGIIK